MKSSIKNKLLFFLYPFRDSVGLNVGTTPFRIGEIYTVIYSFLNLFKSKTYKNYRINKRVRNIFLLMGLNFLLVYLVSSLNYDTIDSNFFIRYIVRNGITMFLFFCVYKVFIAFDDNLMVRGMKWNVILQILAGVLFFVFSQRIFMNHLASIWDIQTAEYGGFEFPRYSGTSSEAGYLGPMLALPLYYFLCTFRKNKIWFAICTVLLLVSLSASNYLILFLTFGYYYFRKNRRHFFRLITYFSIFAIAIIMIVELFMRGTVVYTIFDQNLQKLIAYVTLGSYGTLDWSASDRTQHLANAFDMFVNGSPLQIVFGHGTGAYSYAASHNSNLLVQNVEEAYNIYLSTLTDRGIIGLVIFIAIFYNVYKLKSKNIMSDAIWFALFIQLIHYMIVGNMWLYYVWQEVLFLIGYEIYYSTINNNKITVNNGELKAQDS